MPRTRTSIAQATAAVRAPRSIHRPKNGTAARPSNRPTDIAVPVSVTPSPSTLIP